MNAVDKAILIAHALDEKKARDIQILEIRELTSLGEYFVICTCSSAVQVKAAADSAEEKMSEAGFEVSHREGYNTGSWILLDFGEVIVHVMSTESREMYSIETLWGDAPKIPTGIEEAPTIDF